jgi:uncharacterized protein
VQRWLLRGLIALTPLLASIPALGGGQPIGAVGPDGLLLVPPLARVVDQPGVLPAADRSALEDRLARFESDNGAQVAIVIVASTGIEPIEDFGHRVGSTWKIGRRDIGDGLLLLVATQDRRARIEVARALEGAIPDVIAKRVVQQGMGPHFKAGDYAGGLNAALDDLLPRIEQEHFRAPLGSSASHQPQRAPGNLHLLLPLLVGGVALGLTLRRALGAGGALLAGAGTGTLTSFVLASTALGVLVGFVVLVFGLVLGAAARYGHSIGGPGGIYFPGSWGGGSRGGFGGGGFGGGFSSGGGGDFSGGGASGNW